ncbi:hypothetical protein, partial [Shimia sp.]|uniref:hypothetical protein n=1 Tax=Shimia sp. TaxID=1954381 RepID=UPI0035617B6B
RLNLADFSIHRVHTTGHNPGWINRHSATFDGRDIVVTGGKIEPGFTDMDGAFVLNLETLVWRRMN